jgi:hypothetical protein
MSRYIGQYTATCDRLCLQTKAHKCLLTSYLEPLPTPDTWWHTISIDFIVELPESDGHNAVMVVVDSLTKHAHFLPVNTTITAEGSARQFKDNVWKLHRLPICTISDRGPQFTAAFTTEVYRLLGIKAAKTTAYHLQADSQTEWVNQSWNNTYGCLLARGKMIGQIFCQWWNFSTIITFIPPPSRPPSSLTQDNIRRWVLSHSNHPG